MPVIKKPSRALIMGGLFLIIPLIVLIVLGKHALAILAPLGKKIETGLGITSLFGEATVTIICLLILAFCCYIAGLLLQIGLVSNWGSRVEEKLFLFLPGLQILKYRLLGEEDASKSSWTGILLKEDDHYTLAFITNPVTEPYLSIFIPEIPKMDAGEIRYMKREECVYKAISMKSAMNAVISFGRDGNAWEALIDSPVKESKSDI
jgi:uncharacterized membrane protein